MKTVRIARIPVLLMLAFPGCHDRETSTAPGALANVRVDAPDSARSGETFVIDVSAVAVGINNVRNGHVQVTLPPPLLVLSAEASSGTAATFSNGAGATVSWDLNTLDSNSQSRLHIRASGTLPSGSAAQSLTIRASMTADGVRSGDAVAEDTVQLLP
ncbi:MAG: hypothetical protein ABJC61_01290 [Acidobacteriota bacterium]